MNILEANNEAKEFRSNQGAENLLGLYFPVLDNGFCSLIDYMGNDACIAQAARCSYGAGTRSISNNKGLIRYLINHKHTSPLEMVELKFHMKLPIFVARQIVRHRVANLNELSGRYSIMPLQFYTPEHKDFQYQSTDNKQGRNGIVDEDLYDNWISDHVDLRKYCGDLYVKDLKNETAREIARIDLPLSTYTEWYWKMDLHNLFHFLKLRCDEHAQFETREYANIIAAMVNKVVPISFEAWLDYNYCAKSFSYQDLLALKNLLSEDPWIKSHPCDDLGMTKREIEEFFAKVSAPADKPNFNLDMSLAKSPSYFREESEKCVPEIDGSKP